MLLVTDFGYRCDPKVSGTPWSGYTELVKNHSFGLWGQFCLLLLTDFGFRCDPDISGTRWSGYVELLSSGLFWVVLYVINH